ncbi:MAG: hypothetical protein PVG66_07115 [Chromatiales bacterium]|jgi:copper chaperone CopZ
MVVVSTVAGRLRVRAKRLKSRRIAEQICEQIRTLPGALEVRANPAAGSIIISFDSEQVDVHELEDAIDELCQPPAKNAPTGMSRQLNRITKIGMISTLATSVAYGVAGKKKPHVQYATAFLAFAGMHMLRYSKSLLR